MSAEAVTAISAGCDRVCKWRIAADGLVKDRSTEMSSVPETQEPGDLSPRPTAEGYEQLKDIRDRYQGLEMIVSAGDHCVRACAIERLTEPDSPYVFGSTTREVFNDLRGE